MKGSSGEQIWLVEPQDPDKVLLRNANDLVPLIIPPILDKTNFYSHNSLRALWNEAQNILETASEVVFIGYSLPEGDLASKMLVRSSLQPGTRITVVNKPNDQNYLNELKKRYQELFQEITDPSFNYCKLEGSPIEEWVTTLH